MTIQRESWVECNEMQCVWKSIFWEGSLKAAWEFDIQRWMTVTKSLKVTWMSPARRFEDVVPVPDAVEFWMLDENSFDCWSSLVNKDRNWNLKCWHYWHLFWYFKVLVKLALLLEAQSPLGKNSWNEKVRFDRINLTIHIWTFWRCLVLQYPVVFQAFGRLRARPHDFYHLLPI